MGRDDGYGKMILTETSLESSRMAEDYKRWKCQVCGFVYEEAAGVPEDGIPAGTRWQDVPADWSCPDCGARKEDFAMLDD